jgi:hypothetical protein
LENSSTAKQLLKMIEKANERMKQSRDKRTKIIKPLKYYKISFMNLLKNEGLQAFVSICFAIFIIFLLNLLGALIITEFFPCPSVRE